MRQLLNEKLGTKTRETPSDGQIDRTSLIFDNSIWFCFKARVRETAVFIIEVMCEWTVSL
jgi:hypothetical protein